MTAPGLTVPFLDLSLNRDDIERDAKRLFAIIRPNWEWDHVQSKVGFISDFINPYGTHYNDVIMSAIASQITSLMIVYSTVYTGVDQRKHQRSASLAFATGIHRWPVNSPHKGPVTRKMFPFDDIIMLISEYSTKGVSQWATRTNLKLLTADDPARLAAMLPSRSIFGYLVILRDTE